MSLQGGVGSDILRRTKSPGVAQSDITAAVSGIVTTELLENVINTEEDYSEDLLPEAAAEMGQGTLKYKLCIYFLCCKLDSEQCIARLKFFYYVYMVLF